MDAILLLALIGMAGFLVFCTLGVVFRSKTLVYCAAAFVLLTVSSLMYNSAFIRWAYIDGGGWWNIAITAIGTLVLFSLIRWMLSLLIRAYERNEARTKGACAGMTAAEFMQWRNQKLDELRDRLKAAYGIVYHDQLQKLYEKEEKNLFAKNK